MKIEDLQTALTQAHDSKGARRSHMPDPADAEAEIAKEAADLRAAEPTFDELIDFAAAFYVSAKWAQFAFEQENRRVLELEAQVRLLESRMREDKRQLAGKMHKANLCDGKTVEERKAELREVWADGRCDLRQRAAEEARRRAGGGREDGRRHHRSSADL